MNLMPIRASRVYRDPAFDLNRRPTRIGATDDARVTQKVLETIGAGLDDGAVREIQGDRA